MRRPWPLVVVALALFGFVAYKSAVAPLTHDEAATYFFYVEGPWLNLFNFDEASNHFLNMVLERLVRMLFGPSEWVLRLPALAGFGLFLWYSGRTLARLGGPWTTAALFVVLMANPYALDFFSVARGYGLALGCLAAALYHGVQFWQHRTPRELTASLVWSALATWANFSFLNAFLSLAFVFLLRSVAEAAPTAKLAPFRWSAPQFRHWLLGSAATLLVFAAMALQTGSHLISRNLMAEPVAVQLMATDGPLGVPGAVLRRPPRTPNLEAVPFDAAGGWYRTERQFFKAIVVHLTQEEWRNLEVAEVRIGSFSSRLAKDRLSEGWTVTAEDDGTYTLQSASAVSLGASRIPPLRELINWAGDLTYLGKVFGPSALVAIAIALLGAFLFFAARWLVACGLLARNEAIPLFGIGYALVVSLVVPVLILKSSAALYFGGTTDFVNDTVRSLVQGFAYLAPGAWADWTILLAWSLVALWSLGMLWQVRRLPSSGTSTFFFVGILLGTLAASEIAQFYLLHTPYLLLRTALVFCPVFGLFVVLGLLEFERSLGRGIRAALLGALTLGMALHFALVATPSSIREWRFDAGTKALLERLDHDPVVLGRAADGKTTKVALSWIFHPVVQYYLERKPQPRLEFVFLETETMPVPASSTDVPFLYADEATVAGTLDLSNSVIARFSESGTALYSLSPKTP